MAYAARLDFHFLCIFSGAEIQALTFPNTKSFLYENLQINPPRFRSTTRNRVLSLAKQNVPYKVLPVPSSQIPGKYVITQFGFKRIFCLSCAEHPWELENQAKPLLNEEELWLLVTSQLQ